ncbi:MAG: FliM/FliN family flagellar motor switch protein [Acidobacteria bacterium]|nr:FliM/FliN family flagellar motor switch protein [Acidobacteriota bacterium]
MSQTLKETEGAQPPRLIAAWTRAAQQVFEGLTKVKPELQWKLRQTTEDASENLPAVQWWEAHYEGAGDLRAWIGVATPAALELSRLAHAVVTSGENDAESHPVEPTIESLSKVFADLLSRETGKVLTWERIQRLPEAPQLSEVYATEISLPEGTVLPLLVGFNAELQDGFGQPLQQDPQPKRRPQQQPPSVREQDAGLGPLSNLELPLRVRFGRTQLALERVLQLQVGSVLELEGSREDPVDLLVNGSLVAKGEVVAVEGYYGVRILEVTGKEQRAAALR